MSKFEDETLRTVAVLHDVAEDCGYLPLDFGQLGYPEEVVAALECRSRASVVAP
ncbi:MAG: hypothetical protein AB1700_20160 [Bacillota bacterium]